MSEIYNNEQTNEMAVKVTKCIGVGLVVLFGILLIYLSIFPI